MTTINELMTHWLKIEIEIKVDLLLDYYLLFLEI